MARKLSYYDKLLYLFKNGAAFMPLVMVVFGLLIRQGYADDDYYAGDVVFGSIVAGHIIVSSLYIRLANRKQLTNLLSAALIFAFHVLTALFMLFVSGFLNEFIAIWILLMLGTEIRFGSRGIVASFFGLCATASLFVMLHPELPTAQKVEVLPIAIIMGAFAFVLSRVLAATEYEQSRLTKIREQELYQRERLMALVNSMGDAVIATDDAGIIKIYNSTFLNLLDTNLDLAGKNIMSILNLQDTKNHPINLIDEALQRRAVFSRDDVAHQFADGDRVRLYVNVAPIQPGYHSRAESGFIFILRDITKEKSLEEERDEFVSVVSHELRTPVTIAEGNLSNIRLMFERGVDTKMVVDAVNNSHEQILYLAKLINDLSTLARAERGTGGVPEEIDLPILLHEIYTTYLPQAQAKKLALNLDIAPKVSHVITTKLYLQEVLQNLVTNALKYTREGSIIIRATQTKEFVAISIADTGIGISKADQKRIFEKFYRSEDYRTRESSGTGLGLYVCKKLAEKAGLRIEFESRLNHGSTFTLIVPLGATVPKVVASPAPDSTHSAPSS